MIKDKHEEMEEDKGEERARASVTRAGEGRSMDKEEGRDILGKY